MVSEYDGIGKNYKKWTTYKPPRENTAVSDIFSVLCISTFQMIGTGKPTSTTSMSICGIEYAT